MNCISRGIYNLLFLVSGLWLLVFGVMSCSTPHSNRDKQRPIARLDFDTAYFFRKADSLISEIHHQTIDLRAEITFDPKDSSHIIINMDPGKGNRIMRISMDQYTYNDPQQLNAMFDTLRQEGEDASKEEEIPGLTYTNDFVFKTAKHIYWLNTPCHYSFYNHNTLKRFFIESVFDKTIQDSIVCQCGGSCF